MTELMTLVSSIRSERTIVLTEVVRYTEIVTKKVDAPLMSCNALGEKNIKRA